MVGFFGFHWENHLKIMGKSSENHGKIIRDMMMYDDLLMGFHWILMGFEWILMGCYWDFMGK
jgi:hypothetical protein